MIPSERLEALLRVVVGSPDGQVVTNPANRERLEFVARCRNRAGVRLLMACLLAKLDRPEVDPRKPYTEIGTADAFSGRMYDERYVTQFVQQHRLPCNTTTAFLTPVLRNINRPLTPSIELVGTPRQLYADTVMLLEEVALGREPAEAVLTDLLRVLVAIREEQRQRLETLKATLRIGAGSLPLSSEAIVTLIGQHLACRNSSRLPVLIVAAAYEAAAAQLGETHKPLHGHNAADRQTGAAGDVEITLTSDQQVRTIYEMKQKGVTRDDIDAAVRKVSGIGHRVDNYIFITTDRIDLAVAEYAGTLYESTGGTEFVVLDCVGFLRHFLHLFYRWRVASWRHTSRSS